MTIKISFVNSVCVFHDAISDSIKNEILWLKDTGLYDVKLFCYKCDYKFLPHAVVNSVNEVAYDPHFQSSEIVIFHFGIFSPLFDLIIATPVKSKRVVVFHNITPVEFVKQEQIETITKSYRQVANISLADHVICVSQTNLDTLIHLGIEKKSTVLSLAVDTDINPPAEKPSQTDGRIRIVFIGRFVKSKGVRDLLFAMEPILQKQSGNLFKVDLIGNIGFSDPEVVSVVHDEINRLREAYGNRLHISLIGDAPQALKHQLLKEADIFALPTYHEGFCVPIVEALASGCVVVSYANSNTPAISGGLAYLAETGSIEGLTDAMTASMARITSANWKGNGTDSYEDYRQTALRYVSYYTPENTRRRYVDYILGLK